MIQKYYLIIFLVLMCGIDAVGQNEDCPIAQDLVSQAISVGDIPTMKIAPLTGPGVDDGVTDVACLMPFDFDLITGMVDPNQILPYAEPEGKSYWFSFGVLEAGSFEMIITPDSVNGRPAGNFDFLILEGGCPTNPCTEAIFCGALGPQACINIDGPMAGEPVDYIPTGLADNPLVDYGIDIDPTRLPEIWDAIELKENTNYFILIDHKNPDPIDFAGALGFPSCDYPDLGFTMEFGGTAVLRPTQAAPELNPVIPNNTTDALPSCAFALNSLFRVTNITNADYVWTGPPGSTINGAGNEVTVDYGDMSGQVCVEITCPIQDMLCWDIEISVQPVLIPQNPIPQPCNNLTIDDYAVDEDNSPGTLTLFGSLTDALGLQNQLDLTALNTKGEYWIVKSANVCPSNPLRIETDPIIPILNPIDPISICNTPFDLNNVPVVEINGFQAANDLTLAFFASEIDAMNEANIITEALTAGTYWVKAVTADGCTDLISFDLDDVTPVIETVNTQVDCDNFNLSSIDLQTTDGALIPSSGITFYTSETDARDKVNPINSKIINSNQQIWARGEISDDCFDVVPIDIRISEPEIQPVPAIMDCGDNYDLTNINPQAINNESLNYSFHRTAVDAFNSERPLLSIDIPATVWIRGQNALGCFDTLAVDISSSDPTIVSIPDQNECGNSFNLDDLVINEANGIPLTTSYFGNFADAFGATNEISEIVTATDTYWIRGENNTGCSDVISVNINLTVPNIQQPGNDRLSNGEYDLRDVQILDLDAVEFITNLTFFADSLSADAGTPTLPSPIVTEIRTYWIRGFVGNCPVIVPFGVEAESSASIPITIAPIDLPCTGGDCVNLQTFADEDLNNAFPNLTFLFYLTEDLAEEGLPENALTDLEFCAPSNVWARGSVNNDEFGLAEIIIQDIERATVQLVSGDREICEGDTMNTNLAFQLSGTAPFTVTYSDGMDMFELTIPGTNFEQPVAPTVTTTYSLETAKDANGCDSGPLGGTSTFTVIERVGIDTLNIVCNDLQTSYTVSFNVISGDVNSLDIQGNSGTLTNRTFVSDPIPIDEQYSFTISDQNGCEPYLTSGGWICICETEAAQMDQELLMVCEEGTAEAMVLVAANLVNSDQLFYVLHDSGTEELGNILGVTDDVPIFPYTNILELGTTYYISSVVTKINAVGLPIVDPIENPCLSISVGTPVQFFPLPEVNLTLDKEIACPDEMVNLQFTMNGAGPYNVRYTDGTTTITLENILNGHIEEVPATAATYTVEAINWSTIDNCQSGSDSSATLAIAPALRTENLVLTCDEPGREYTISFEIVGGDSTSYLVDGSADNIVGNLFTSDPLMNQSTYRFEVGDANDCERIVLEDFGQCDCTADITADISVVQAISCEGESDGIVAVQANNGEAPFAFVWEDGSTETQLANVSAGLISVTMTDANECEVVGSFQLDGPIPITPEVELRNPRCFGNTNGSIIIRNVTGGTRPYLFALGRAEPTDAGLYANLEANIYTINITDNAGCEYSEVVELIEPEEFNVSFQNTPTEINLGDSLILDPIVNQNVADISWQSSTPISCEDCLNPLTKPVETARYVLTVTNENGCTATDELLLNVLNDKRIYAPTSFSPNNDGINDTFGLFGGNQVEAVQSLRVFNRWGALLYERTGLPAVFNFEGGWDGKERNGRDAPSGIYIYAAEILFKDGTTEMIRGDVAILR